MRLAAMRARSSAEWADRSVPLGRYWRSSPLVFSLSRAARVVRVAEVDLYAGGDGELGVESHLDALVPGDGPGQFAGQGGDRLAHGLLNQVGVTAFGQVQQQEVAGGPLDQGAHC